MTKTDEKIAIYKEEVKKLGLDIPDMLLEKITRALGPSIFKKDSETVSCSQSSELERIKKNFVATKLHVTPDEKADEAIKAVCEKMGSSNRNKYRAIFYALLAIELNKQDLYV